MPSQEFSNALCFSYGKGVYKRDGHQYKGHIVLTPHKLYLKDDKGEIAETFIPLEKIYKVSISWRSLTFYVRPSTFMQFTAQLKASMKDVCALKRDLVEQRQLHKRKFGLEWIDPEENV